MFKYTLKELKGLLYRIERSPLPDHIKTMRTKDIKSAIDVLHRAQRICNGESCSILISYLKNKEMCDI